ncbi:MAG: terminase small subunit [Lysobacterales bacterium]
MPALKNAKHEHFCQLISDGATETKAAVLAGFSERSAPQQASRLLKNDEIRERVAELRAEKEQFHAKAVQRAMENAGIDKEWVMRNLKEVVERCMEVAPVVNQKGEQVVVETPEGELRAAFTFNAKGAIGALVPLGKEIGMFVERKEVRHGKLEDLPDAQLDDLIRELATEAGITPKVVH